MQIYTGTKASNMHAKEITSGREKDAVLANVHACGMHTVHT